MDAAQLAVRIHNLLENYEPPEHHLISNYVEATSHIRAVRIDGEFDLEQLAYNILVAVEDDKWS